MGSSGVQGGGREAGTLAWRGDSGSGGEAKPEGPGGLRERGKWTSKDGMANDSPCPRRSCGDQWLAKMEGKRRKGLEVRCLQNSKEQTQNRARVGMEKIVVGKLTNLFIQQIFLTGPPMSLELDSFVTPVSQV